MRKIKQATPWPNRLNPQSYLDYLIVEKGASPHTTSNYERDLRRYVDFLEDCGITSLREVTGTDLEAFVQFLGIGDRDHPPLAPASVRRALSAARSWHRWAREAGETNHDPATAVKPSKPGKHLPNVLSIADTQKLLEAAGDEANPNALRDRALLEFLYATGARISEATGLAVDDLDFDPPHGEIPLVRLYGKGRKERLAMLGSFAVESLQAYLVRARPSLSIRGRSQGKVFLNTLGRPLSRQSAWAIIQQAASRANLTQQIGPHTLRHCFATHLLAGGADVRAVQELLGHASVSTTQIYTNITRDMIKEVYTSSHPRAVNTNPAKLR